MRDSLGKLLFIVLLLFGTQSQLNVDYVYLDVNEIHEQIVSSNSMYTDIKVAHITAPTTIPEGKPKVDVVFPVVMLHLEADDLVHDPGTTMLHKSERKGFLNAVKYQSSYLS